MKVLYLTTDGAKLVKKGNVLKLMKDKDVYHTIFPHQTEQIFIIGNIEITTPAFKLLMKHKIDTVFISKNGKFHGKLTFNPSKNIYLRLKQYKLLEDEEFKVNLSKSIINAKIKNQITFLQRIYRSKKNPDVKYAINKLKENLQSLENAQSVESIRGIEGIASKNYFSVFRHAILPDFAVFRKRTKNPPEDNVNAVLSFVYTLIYFRVDSYLEAEGLDSYAGYLHSLDYGRKSLAFDLMEEYRTPLGETFTVALFNLGILNKDDFREVIFSKESEDYPLEPDIKDSECEIISEKKGVLLTKNGLRKVISHFEKRLNTEYFYTPENRKIFYKKIIHYQIKHFKRVILGEEKFYKPLVIK